MKHDTAIPAGRRVYIDFLKVIAIYLVLFNHTGVSGFVLFTVRQGTKMYFPLMFNAILIKIAVPLFSWRPARCCWEKRNPMGICCASGSSDFLLFWWLHP